MRHEYRVISSLHLRLIISHTFSNLMCGSLKKTEVVINIDTDLLICKSMYGPEPDMID